MGSKSDNNCGFSFNFKLPSEDLALRSVLINDGIPELIFDAAMNVPTLTEEDVGIACRLACEGIRPEFFYYSIPAHHPLHGRQYKHYSPEWLKGTVTGELLAEVDWSMKCLSIGARSDETKERFESWQNKSKLIGLASRLDFLKDKPAGSIKMSCKSVKIQESENEMIFLEEPKLRIDTDTSSSYTQYITNYLDSIAFYDEPLFLKMKELIKLILAAEWLKEKGVRFSRPWMKKCSAPQLESQSIEVKTKGPDEDEVKEKSMWHLLQQLPATSKEVVMTDLGPLSVENVVEKGITEEGIEVKVTTTVLPSDLSSPKVEKTTTIRASVNNYDWLYSSLDPKMPIFPEIPGQTKAIVPSVQSWSELISQTVPWPRIWKMPYCEGAEMVSAAGGVTTGNIPVTKVPPPVSQPSTTTVKQHKADMKAASSKVHVKAKRGHSRKTHKVRKCDVPKVDEVNVPPKEATSNTQLSVMNRKQKAQQPQGIAYGWEDSSGGQRKVYDEGGNLIAQQRSMRSHVKEETKVNGNVTQYGYMRASIPLAPQIGSEGRAEVQPQQAATVSQNYKEPKTSRQSISNHQEITPWASEDAGKEKESEARVSENVSASSSEPMSLPIPEPPQAQPQLLTGHELTSFSPATTDSGILSTVSSLSSSTQQTKRESDKMPNFCADKRLHSKSATSSDGRRKLLGKQQSKKRHVEQQNKSKSRMRQSGHSNTLTPQIHGEEVDQVQPQQVVANPSRKNANTTRQGISNHQEITPCSEDAGKEKESEARVSENVSASSSEPVSLPIPEPPQAQPQLLTGHELTSFSPATTDSGSLSTVSSLSSSTQQTERESDVISNHQELTPSEDAGKEKESQARVSENGTAPPEPSSLTIETQPACQLQVVRETLFSPGSVDSGISLSTVSSLESSTTQQNSGSDKANTKENKMPSFDADKDIAKSDSSSDDSGHISPDDSGGDEKDGNNSM